MKRLLLAPLLLTLIVGCSSKNEVKTDVNEVKTDVRLLCLRSQRAYDLSFRADDESSYYSMKVWLPAYQEEAERLSDIRREKRHAYVRTLVPLLKLAGYERPEFYLWYYTSYHDEIRERHNIRNLGKIEEWKIGQDYYAHGASGADTRDELCKLYGYEFNDRYYDQQFKKKYKLKDW